MTDWLVVCVYVVCARVCVCLQKIQEEGREKAVLHINTLHRAFISGEIFWLNTCYIIGCNGQVQTMSLKWMNEWENLGVVQNQNSLSFSLSCQRRGPVNADAREEKEWERDTAWLSCGSSSKLYTWHVNSWPPARQFAFLITHNKLVLTPFSIHQLIAHYPPYTRFIHPSIYLSLPFNLLNTRSKGFLWHAHTQPRLFCHCSCSTCDALTGDSCR